MSNPSFNVFSLENTFSAEILQNNFIFSPGDLTGSWKGKDVAITVGDDGTGVFTPKVVTTEKTIELKCDEHGALTGTVSYVVINGNGHDYEGNPVQSGHEDVIGFVNNANGEITLVEYNSTLAESESGTFRGFLRNNNSLELTQTQTYPNANPLVSFMCLPKV